MKRDIFSELVEGIESYREFLQGKKEVRVVEVEKESFKHKQKESLKSLKKTIKNTSA